MIDLYYFIFLGYSCWYSGVTPVSTWGSVCGGYDLIRVSSREGKSLTCHFDLSFPVFLLKDIKEGQVSGNSMVHDLRTSNWYDLMK